MGCSNVLLKKMKKGLVYYENFLTYLNLKMMRYIFKQIPFFFIIFEVHFLLNQERLIRFS